MRVLVGLLCFGAAGAATAAKQALDDTTIRVAVKAWFDDRAAAEAKYGHIKDWDTSGVTDLKELFCARERSIMLVLQHGRGVLQRGHQRVGHRRRHDDVHTSRPISRPTSRRCAGATAAPTTPTGSTTRATRASRGATTSPPTPPRSRSGARGASARTASRRLKHASRRAASARRRATHKYSLPGASTPLPRSLPIV